MTLNGGYRTWFGAAIAWAAGGFKGKVSHRGLGGNKEYSVLTTNFGEDGFDWVNHNSYGNDTFSPEKIKMAMDAPNMGLFEGVEHSLPHAYIEANAAVIQGQVGGGVRFLGSRVEVQGEFAKSPIYQLGFNLDTSRENQFENTSTLEPILGTDAGISLAKGVGVSVMSDIKSAQLKEVTTSFLIGESTYEFHLDGVHAGKVSRQKVGINIGASGAFFVGAEAGFKIGFIFPYNN